MAVNETPVNDSSAHRIYRKDAEWLLDRNRPGTFNQAVMELGALVCTPKAPRCEHCPWNRFCNALKRKAVSRYPIRRRSKPLPVRYYTAGIVVKKSTVLLARRAAEGLLGGLWEFPGGEIPAKIDAETACRNHLRKKMNIDITVGRKAARIQHAYTHFRVILDVFFCRYRSGRIYRRSHSAHRWIRPEKIHEFPLPKTHHHLIPLLHDAALELYGEPGAVHQSPGADSKPSP